LRGVAGMAMLQAMTEATRNGAADDLVSTQPRRVPQGLARPTTPNEGAHHVRTPQELRRGLPPRPAQGLAGPPARLGNSKGAADVGISQPLRGLPPRLPQASGLPQRLAHGLVRTPTTTPKTSEGGRHVRIPQPQRALASRPSDAPGLPPLAHGLAPLTRRTDRDVRTTGLTHGLSTQLGPPNTTGRRGAC
jgi:hypothetical protein